jgi:asparagine synthase (glutamine-hydrolysing)
MCGIAGYFGKKPPSETIIRSTLTLMKKRGPDYQDFASFAVGKNKQVLLLHSRLSIIDLDPRSNQPFSIDESTIVYNGEIYNYIELRKQLLNRGVELKTTSDTEVLLYYYMIYGERCVDHFEGMWSFAIWDAKHQKLFLSRDRFAEKPLYYLQTSEGFFFASEVKFLKGLSNAPLRVNRNHLLRQLVNGYKSLYKTDETFFEGVKELRYAQSMVLNPDGVNRINRYWTPSTTVDQSMSLENAIDGTREHLLESVRLRLRSDVPLAFCLSGGVDSASLVSIAAKEFGCELETFSIIDEDERYNEEENIMATVDDIGCNHHLLQIPKEDALDRLGKLIEYHDAPVATITYYVHSLISEAVHNAGFRVAFSGSSADELFTGYYDHFILHLNEVRNENDYQKYLQDWRNHIEGFVRNPMLKTPNLYDKDPTFRNHIFDASEELKDYLVVNFEEPFQEEQFCNSLLRNRMLNELFYEATPVILHEDDLNSMCYSVENRSPFLDSSLQKFAYSIPARHLIRDGYGKFVLRQSLKGILNEKVRLDRRKKGFNASINSMINFQDPNTQAYLLDPKAEIFHYLDRNKIKQLFDLFPIPNHFSKFLFNFINARIFLEIYN